MERILSAAMLCAVLAWAGTAALLSAQEAAPVIPEAEPAIGGVSALPVIIDGEELFMLRGSSALPADERVAVVQDRVIEAAEESDSEIVVVTVEPNELGRAILVNGKLVNITTEADAEYDQMSIEVLSRLHAGAIEKAILDYRTSRSETARIQSATQAIAWTIAFAAFFYGIWKFRQWFPDWLAGRVEKRFAGVEKATMAIVQGRAVASVLRFLLRSGLLVLLFLIFYYYLSLVLLSFAETQAVAQILLTYITEPILNVLLGFVSYIPNLLTLAFIVLVTGYILRGAKLFFQNIETGVIKIRDFQDHWIWPTYNIVRAATIMIALVLSFPYIPGSGSAAFQGITILVGIMVSLGSNSVVANIMSGLFVLYRRSTNIGDRIRVGEHVGDVVQIKLMETHLKSIKNELVSIPNAHLLNSEVVNYSSMIDGRGLMLHTSIGIGYEEPQEKVEAMLIEAARRTNGIRKNPSPFVLRKALSDFAVTYEINAFTSRGNRIPQLLSDLHSHILDIFHANGVQIMTPSYEGDPDEKKIAPAEWDGNLAGVEKT